MDFTPVDNVFIFIFCYFPTNAEGVLLRKPLCQLLKLTCIPPGMQRNESTRSQGSNEAPTENRAWTQTRVLQTNRPRGNSVSQPCALSPTIHQGKP